MVSVNDRFSRTAENSELYRLNKEKSIIASEEFYALMQKAIAMMVDLLSKPGDEVIVPMPAYQPFIRIVDKLGRKLTRWPLLYDEQSHTFSLDWKRLEQLSETAKLMIFCNPHNPSGIDFSQEDLQKLCDIAERHQVTILCDEIHGWT